MKGMFDCLSAKLSGGLPRPRYDHMGSLRIDTPVEEAHDR